MVDDSSLYSEKLIDGLSSLGTGCVLYAPLSPISSKSPRIMVKLGPEAIRVWNGNLFPLQILKRVMKDRPDIVHVQFEFYGIHSFGPTYASIGLPILLALLRLAHKKSLVTLHSILPRTSEQLSKLREASPIARRVPAPLIETFLTLNYKLVGLLADGLIVHAQALKRRLCEQYRIKQSKVTVIPHGVDTQDSPPARNSMDVRIASNRILYFGVISPRKGIENLLSAFAMLKKIRDDCELMVAGTSPPYYHGYEMELKDQAVRLGLGQRVHFLGEVDDAEAHRLFEQARFVVLPYSFDVSASGVLSWAIGHAVPVIVSENEYFREELSNSKFGLMVSPGNPESLAEAMEMLFKEENLLTSLSQHSRKIGLSRSWNIVATMTTECYKKTILGGKSASSPSVPDRAETEGLPGQ